MKIENVEVAFLERSKQAAGLSYGSYETPACVHSLARARDGHDHWLTGVRVAALVTASHVWWMQAQRYHWFEIVMSTSKMHSLLKMDLEFSDETTTHMQLEFTSLRNQVAQHASEADRKQMTVMLSHAAPLGLCLAAEVSTNYLTLKNMYIQRHRPMTPEWRTFCDWILTLPEFPEI